jgi:hypothetical protein
VAKFRAQEGYNVLETIGAVGKCFGEYATKWTKYKNERAAQRFERLVKPTFEAMKVVHSDYLSFIESSMRDVKAGKSLKEIADSLEQLRLTHEPDRESIISQARAIRSGDRANEFYKFFTDVGDYFVYLPFGDGTAASMILHTLRRAIEDEGALVLPSASLTRGEQARQQVVEVYERLLQHIRRAWAELNRSYAECLAKAV